MRVKVEFDNCVAAGMCSLMAPRVFEQDEEDGRVILLTETPDPEDFKAVREAAA